MFSNLILVTLGMNDTTYATMVVMVALAAVVIMSDKGPPGGPRRLV